MDSRNKLFTSKYILRGNPKTFDKIDDINFDKKEEKKLFDFQYSEELNIDSDYVLHVPEGDIDLHDSEVLKNITMEELDNELKLSIRYEIYEYSAMIKKEIERRR